MAGRTCVLLALLSSSLSAGAAPVLHRDAGLATSGCKAVVRTLSEMLANPPEELRGRTVDVEGGAPVPFTRTRAYGELSLKQLCASARLAAFRPDMSLIGERGWTQDSVPDYSASSLKAGVHPELLKVCRRLVKRHSDALLAAMSGASEPRASLCEALSGHPPPPEFGGGAWAAHTLRRLWEDPMALLRLLPLILVAACLPRLMLPLFSGRPAVPEPRGPLLEGEADDDVAGAGCLPGKPKLS